MKPGALIPFLVSIQEKPVPSAYRHLKHIITWSARIEVIWQRKNLKDVINAIVSYLSTCVGFPLPLRLSSIVS